MTELGINPNKLSGHYRSKYSGSTMVFKTFATLNDPVEYFGEAMKTELEHMDVSKGDAMITARIAAAHIKGVEYNRPGNVPFPDYYDWLWYIERLHESAMKNIIKKG